MSYPAPKVPLQNLDAKAMPSCLAREADALPSVSRRDNESNNATGGLCRLPDLGSGETFCRFGVVAFKR